MDGWDHGNHHGSLTTIHTTSGMSMTSVISTKVEAMASGEVPSSTVSASNLNSIATSVVSVARENSGQASTTPIPSNHGGGHGNGGMTTTFTNGFSSPLLFKDVNINTSGRAFAAFVVIFSFAFLLRGLMAFRHYMEVAIFKKPEASNNEFVQPKYPPPFKLKQALVRGALAFVISVLSYSLMLVVMSFSVLWFFAVVFGVAMGKMVFGRYGS